MNPVCESGRGREIRGGGEARNGGRKTSEEGFFGTSHSAAAFPRKMEGSKSKKEQRYLV